MGSLRMHDVAGLVKEYGLDGFVETGLYKGEGLNFAASFPAFKKLVSIDMVPRWITAARKRLRQDPDDRVCLLLGNSFDVLPTALELVRDTRVLWWLDAHFPESCLGDRMDFKGNKIHDVSTTFPLHKELEVIVTERDISGDVFLMDDLRIYEKGAYRWGNWNSRDKYDNPGDSSFVYELLNNTHVLTSGLEEHGYIIAKPKGENGSDQSDSVQEFT